MSAALLTPEESAQAGKDPSYGSCPICLEEFDNGNDVETGQPAKKRLESSPSCKHAFCVDCLFEYCRCRISDRHVPITCPQADKNCEEILSDDLVRNILKSSSEEEDDSESWNKKYHRYKRLNQDPTLIACPKCDELVTSNNTGTATTLQGNQDLQQQARRLCPACRHVFCARHGDSHPGMTCDEYKKTAQAKQVRKSEKSLKQWTKPCSHCGVHLQKARGCDYMVCSACRRDMCWKCGTHVHLTGESSRLHCAQCRQKYHGHRRQESNWLTQLQNIFAAIGYVSFTLLWIPLAALAGLLSCFFCGCFGCGRWISGDASNVVKHFAAVRIGFIVVFFPVLLVLQAAGCCNFPLLDWMEGDRSEEIPTMEVVGEGNEADDAV